MGLSGPKKRNRISEDPNNTAWSRCTTRYGHRILESQGWKPGEYLGARDAPHSSHYESASAGHVRIILKEDNAGLGAGLIKQKTETYGLSGFQGILGRLNGKSDTEIRKDAIVRRDVNLRLYTDKRYGFMNFVSGGFLAKDTVEHQGKKTGLDNAVSTGPRSHDETSEVASKSRKRKRKAEEGSDAPRIKKSEKKARKDNSHVSKAETESPQEDVGRSVTTDGIDCKVEKTKVKAKKRVLEEEIPAKEEEWLQRKSERRARREERRRQKLTKQEQTEEPLSKQVEEIASNTLSRDVVLSKPPPSHAPIQGRQAVRQRYIQQKKLASLDSQALNEIFMVKA
ncbi:hypothetical protein EV356DRAFT_502434 [Viridothelium virens]|uniref:PinX1-related protein 1 n=1 Tax=Viridothelium virens TaxID=1048519 RepID=A0A6A6HN14_VIRVR|nr:hypothetical protein EV356DRAFT_502434 [Viridothelium virens]